MRLRGCAWLWHLSRLAVVKSEDCFQAVEFIYVLSPLPALSITLEIRGGNYLETIDVWGWMFFGFCDLDQSLS